MCQKGAREVQEKVLARANGPNLRVYTVWMPMLSHDRHSSAQKATRFVSDDRTLHFWTSGLETANLFQAPINLANEPAWDVYLLYGPHYRRIP
jgi:hypothetical protein